MTDVAGLQDRIEDKMSKAVDIKEALLKKKDDQLQGKNISRKIAVSAILVILFLYSATISIDCQRTRESGGAETLERNDRRTAKRYQ